VQTSAGTGAIHLALEFFDNAYQPVSAMKSAAGIGADGWRRLSAEAAAPEGARWLRMVLHSESNSAVWFDDAEIVRAQ